MARFDLTDFEWSIIQPLLPQKSRGVKRVDDRRVLNGIFWRLPPRADILSCYGPYTTCVNRFNRWRKAGIRAMPNRVNKPAFSAWLYRQRNLVERFFNKLKQFRAVATRYDKRDDNFMASVQLASIRIWIRRYESAAWRKA